MNFLIHTCLISEFKKPQPEPKVISWLSDQFEESLYLSVITIGEIQRGISLLADSRKKTELESWLHSLIIRYNGRILGLDSEELTFWGEMVAELEKRGRILPLMDSLIAVTALSHDLTLVTRNETDFEGTGVRVLNIWN
jgi:predicted nucleic acid-binding protein